LIDLEVESTVMPVLSEVEIKSKVLQRSQHTDRCTDANYHWSVLNRNEGSYPRTRKQSSPSNSFYKIYI